MKSSQGANQMKSTVKGLGLLAACIALASFSQAATIVGTKHDFTVSYNGMAVATNQCSTCHAMHKPLKTAQLWARSGPAGTGWLVYNGASGVALAAVTGGNIMTSAEFTASKSGACLSCHDGATAIGGTTLMAAGTKNLGTNLSTMHPVAKQIVAGQTTGAGGAMQASIANAVVDVVGAKSFVSCASCHAIHTGTGSKILRTGVNAGGICLDCHVK